jgi:hypothetical protein
MACVSNKTPVIAENRVKELREFIQTLSTETCFAVLRALFFGFQSNFCRTDLPDHQWYEHFGSDLTTFELFVGIEGKWISIFSESEGRTINISSNSLLQKFSPGILTMLSKDFSEKFEEEQKIYKKAVASPYYDRVRETEDNLLYVDHLVLFPDLFLKEVKTISHALHDLLVSLRDYSNQ